MATTKSNLSSSHSNIDEDYIDMEVSSCFFYSSSPQSREFEFQMSSIPHDKRESNPSPADELFYKGKLLPLHLPPRLQMVQKLLQSSTSTTTTTSSFEEATKETDEHCSIINPSINISSSSTAPSTNTSTPLDSCNISQSESCRVSCELNPTEYFFEWSTELRSFINNHPKKSLSKKLKQSSLSQKLKASRAYLRSIFSKSACSAESCANAACNLEAEKVAEARDFSSKYMKIPKKTTPFGYNGRGSGARPSNNVEGKSNDKEGIEENIDNHRRSFSGAIKRHSPSKCLSSSSSSSSGASSLSSSFSVNSNALYDLHFLRRSSSVASEIEGSIEAAIAHCKNSQQLCNSTHTLNGLCSFSTSEIVPSYPESR